MTVTTKQLSLATIVPFVVGLILSFGRVIPPEAVVVVSNTEDSSGNATASSWVSKRRRAQLAAEYGVAADAGGDPFRFATLALHRNGDVEPCAVVAATSPDDDDDASSAVMEAVYAASSRQRRRRRDKYEWEATLTRALARSLLSRDECASTRADDAKGWFGRGHNGKGGPATAFLGFCDAGPERTPILLDHQKLVKVSADDDDDDGGPESLPCHFHTREGVRITSVQTLLKEARKKVEECSSSSSSPRLELYAVPAGRVYMFAPRFVGEIFELPHVTGTEKPVHLEVLSLSPKVFDVINFFSVTESDAIVRKAIHETSETHRIKRSSTGASGYNLNSQRTSENGFDTHGRDAMTVKRRCFNVLGFDEYVEGMADGLQVLRYNKTTAYVPHLDWIDDYQKREEHDFDSERVGANRFATILLYMSDLPPGGGGETVFAKGWPSHVDEKDRVPLDESLREVRETGAAAVANLKQGSWEEEMVAQCRSRLSVVPNSARAVLFYSQHPDGRPDQDSLHGGCPVLEGSKWAANLWVWNAVRGGYEGSPVNQDVVDRNAKARGGPPPPGPQQLQATFTNTGHDPAFRKADLYFQETFWGPFGQGDPPLSVNTYEGHEWNVMVDGKVQSRFVIGKESEHFSV